MLPPFVPLFARTSDLHMPPITAFCVQMEQSFSLRAAQQENQQITLDGADNCLQEVYVPSITDYVVDVDVSSPSVPPLNDVWLDEERDAFDWQSFALLATKKDDKQDVEGGSTGSMAKAEYLATVLMRVARRVRAGELKVEVAHGVRTEAALAATLAALLKE